MNDFKQIFSRNSFLYLASITSFIILVVIVFLFPVESSEYRNTDTLAPVWYLITMSGGIYGGTAVVVGLLIYLLIYFRKSDKKKKYVYYFVTIVFLIQILIAGTTLYIIKDSFHNKRPSQLYFEEKGFINNGNIEFYSMPLEEKRNYLRKEIKDNADSVKEIYPPILDDWVYESGYSFPSGHSETSFFLGTMIAFVIFRTTSKKYLTIIPFVWAILVALSRVIIGIHYPSDVTAGALVGLTAGLIVISIDKINKIFA